MDGWGHRERRKKKQKGGKINEVRKGIIMILF